MVILSFLAAVATMIIRGFARDTTRIVTAQKVRQEHDRWLDAAAAVHAISRADERSLANNGLARHAVSGVVP
jgi:cytochrome o ubiquinol oxidase subunit 1